MNKIGFSIFFVFIITMTLCVAFIDVAFGAEWCNGTPPDDVVCQEEKRNSIRIASKHRASGGTVNYNSHDWYELVFDNTPSLAPEQSIIGKYYTKSGNQFSRWYKILTVVRPVLDADQYYASPVDTFDGVHTTRTYPVVDMTAQEIQDRDEKEKINALTFRRKDFLVYKMLLGKGLIVPADIPQVVKDAYQAYQNQNP